MFMIWNLLLCDSGLDSDFKNIFFRWIAIQARKTLPLDFPNKKNIIRMELNKMKHQSKAPRVLLNYI